MATEGAINNKLRLIPDIPWGEGRPFEDGLGFSHYATGLAQTAVYTPEAFTVGIYGDWGSGKTSLMRMIKSEIDTKYPQNVIPVWFNAWRYEEEKHLIVPLLATIIKEIKGREGYFVGAIKTLAEEFILSLRGFLYGCSASGKLKIPSLTETELSLSPKDMLDRYDKLKEATTDQIVEQSLYYNSFERLDELSREGEAFKLVIFIDDLDRCTAESAFKLLEKIKLFLNLQNITFILGVADKIISKYLSYKHKKELGIPEDLYSRYLEKLVQFSFRIPNMEKHVEFYVQSIFQRKFIFGEISDDEFKSRFEPLISICGPACQHNPRQIVRFLNRILHLDWFNRVHLKSKVNVDLVYYGIATALQMSWPDLLRAFKQNRAIVDIREDDGRPTDLVRKFSDIIYDNFYDAVYRYEDKAVAKNFALDILEKYSAMDKNPYKDAFLCFVKDNSLIDLFLSEPGLEWLQNSTIRSETIEIAYEVPVDVEPHKEDEEGIPTVKGFELKPGAVIINEDLSGEKIMHCDMTGANLRKAKFTGATLVDVILDGAKLYGTNFEGCLFTDVSVDQARFDKDTVWPIGFDPEDGGAILE